MATITDTREAPARQSLRQRLNRRWLVGITIALWLALFAVLRGRDTLDLQQADVTPLHTWLNSVNDTVGASRDSNPLFLYFFNEIRLVISAVATSLQSLLSQPVFDRPLPIIGWLGVVALVGFVSWALGNWRVGLLASAGFFFMGLQGLWQPSMDTLALTLTAVLFSLLVGIPLGVWAGTNDRVNTFLTPILDFMQTMPTFVYLAPLVLLFAIGPASATIATFIYAAPPVIRITAARHPAGPPRDDRGGGVARDDTAADAAQGHPPGGQAHGRHRDQPDHHGGPVDGHPGGADRRTRARPRGPGGAEPPRHRHGLQRRSRDRHHGHRLRPGDHRRQRPQRAGASRTRRGTRGCTRWRWRSARP